jgi:hypothetical protein
MATVVDSYSEDNHEGVGYSLYSGSVVSQYGQSFTGDGRTTYSVVLYLKKIGSPTGSATVSIYAHTGTYGTSSKPTGDVLAISDNFDVSELTTSYKLETFTFSGANKITLTNGSYYVCVLSYSGGDSGNCLNFAKDTNSPTHAGNGCYLIGSSWFATSTEDLIFYVYGAVCRYWVGGTGNWSDDDNHWATTSGGTPADGNLPTSSDDVYFDSNSFSGADQYVDLNGYYSCHNMDWTGATNNPTFRSTKGTLQLYGSLTFIADMHVNIYSEGKWVNVYAYSTGEEKTITSAGQVITAFVTQDTGASVTDKWTIMDDFTTGALEVYSGTFDANDYNVISGGFYIEDVGGGTTIIYMGSGTWEVNESYGWNLENYGNLTLYCETSTVKFTDTSSYSQDFYGGGLTYNKVWFTGASSGDIVIHDSNTIGELVVDNPPNTINFPSGGTQTVGTLDISGTSSNLNTINSSNETITISSSTTHTFGIGKISNTIIGQIFSNTPISQLIYTRIALKRTGTATNYAIRCSVYKDNSGVLGDLVCDCDDDLLASSISTSSAHKNFYFTGANLSASTKYWFVIKQIGGTLSDTNYCSISLRLNNTDPYSGGESYYKNGEGGAWALIAPLGGVDYADIISYYYIKYQHNLSKSSGTISCDYLDISNSNATGWATWYAGSHSVDTFNNDGWIFESAPDTSIKDIISSNGFIPSPR